MKLETFWVGLAVGCVIGSVGTTMALMLFAVARVNLNEDL